MRRLDPPLAVMRCVFVGAMAKMSVGWASNWVSLLASNVYASRSSRCRTVIDCVESEVLFRLRGRSAPPRTRPCGQAIYHSKEEELLRYLPTLVGVGEDVRSSV